MSRDRVGILLALVVVIFAAGCAGTTETPKTAAPPSPVVDTARETVVIFGPPGFKRILTAFEPFIDNMALRYDFQIWDGASTEAGVKGVLEGAFDLMILMRYPRPDEPLAYTEFVQTPVGIFVNPDAGIQDLTRAQAASIFSGEITNWSEIGGPDQVIIVYAQEFDESMTIAVQDYLLNGRPLTASAKLLPEESAVFPVVESVPGAISYAAWAGEKYFEFVQSTKYVDAVTLDGMAPDDPQYPFVSPIGFAYLPERQADLQPILDWGYDFLESSAAQNFLAQFGVRPPFGPTRAP